MTPINFNPRPLRGATDLHLHHFIYKKHFNPHSPHGERLQAALVIFQSKIFQPTLPARGATCKTQDRETQDRISTHTPRTGSDSKYEQNRLKNTVNYKQKEIAVDCIMKLDT